MENNGGFQLRYDERNRLDRVTVGALTMTYGVNGLGERVAKDGQQSFGKVEFVYGLSGGALGQYNASGAAAEEYVWLGDLPIGTIQGGAAYTIAPDHLGAPHQIVNSSNAQVWFWNHDPFGNGAPSAAAGFAHRLRFPGQVYDGETGLHSNGQRDYDPRLGRYVESDPIGLAGGINTYAYAGNNPVSAIDPLGLDPKSNEDDAEELPSIDIGARCVTMCHGSDPGYRRPMSPTEAFVLNSLSIAMTLPIPGAGGRAIGPLVGGGARLENLTAREIARIQNAANRTGVKISVVGSRAKGTARAISDWDYVVPEGTNSRTIHSSVVLCPKDQEDSVNLGIRTSSEKLSIRAGRSSPLHHSE